MAKYAEYGSETEEDPSSDEEGNSPVKDSEKNSIYKPGSYSPDRPKYAELPDGTTSTADGNLTPETRKHVQEARKITKTPKDSENKESDSDTENRNIGKKRRREKNLIEYFNTERQVKKKFNLFGGKKSRKKRRKTKKGKSKRRKGKTRSKRRNQKKRRKTKKKKKNNTK